MTSDASVALFTGLIAWSFDQEFKPISLCVGLTIDKPFVSVQIAHATMRKCINHLLGSRALGACHTKEAVDDKVVMSDEVTKSSLYARIANALYVLHLIFMSFH
jgi:hypothetical protein